MKTTAVLMNVSRGACVIEEDLWLALQQKQIAGAIIDVWWGEHDSGDVSKHDRAWHTLDNVVMTPHASGWTHEGVVSRRCLEMAQNLDALATGVPLNNVVHQ
eukprot:gnl/MRDRNA2_/MRDRNA2_76958_c0_seq1.p1 gnl/MRDRNA2_/MRDRNA2_76958_c0~~gnl/MRDRNA2_/MRDRNA2_76958_c0_seq1.p1  ORF type:complete len:102 (+),score=15.96 gnl/MRDRNA2_/MRDRNA2_76958_c0_seq1:161-466(+)